MNIEEVFRPFVTFQEYSFGRVVRLFVLWGPFSVLFWNRETGAKQRDLFNENMIYSSQKGL